MIETTWEVITYDVLGNSKDGYEVNDSYSHGQRDLTLDVIRNNAGTKQEFLSAYPTNDQIKEVFGVDCEIELEGDDTHIEVNTKKNGRPIGRLVCTSHESLSSIKEV